MKTLLHHETWTGTDVTIRDIERELQRLRSSSAASGSMHLRTSVLTHIAWVPREWRDAAEETLQGLAERHPSRTLILTPEPTGATGIDAELALRSFAAGQHAVYSEVISLTLRGATSLAPASIALPLLISDLPVFLRWRGRPDFGGRQWRQLVGVADRVVIDRYAAWLEHRAGLVVQTKLVRNRGQGFTYILGQSIRANTLVRKGWHLLLTYETLPYQVKGQHRVPAPAHHVVTTPRAQHVRVGMATWYDYVPGRCATWYLPYGKRLYIKDLQTGKIISCVNTDREAAHGNRVVDLSQTQFSQLAPLTKGVIPVRVWW
jgi:hypothetical protein